MGKIDRIPVALVRGATYVVDEQASAQQLIRPANKDLFR
jgi:F420-0:gamma-glutamyl ligase